MGKVLDHKCPSCDSNLKFNPKTQNWKCEYCNNTYELKDLKQKKLKKNNKEINLNVYTCPDCGAQIVVDENTSATSCVYCRNSALICERLTGDFNPEYVIPFKTTKKDSITAFKNLLKYKLLIPKKFKSDENINEIKGVYIPFWLFDYSMEGKIKTECNHVIGSIVYDITAEGNISFKNIPIDGSKKFNDNLMDALEPFDYNDLTKFKHSYLAGFYAEKYDMDSKEVIERVKTRAMNTFKTKIAKKMKERGYINIKATKKEVTSENSSAKYALLPVWLLNTRYKDKMYTFAMNGQTGKIYGNIPISRIKEVILGIILFVIMYVLNYVIFSKAFKGLDLDPIKGVIVITTAVIAILLLVLESDHKVFKKENLEDINIESFDVKLDKN